MINNKHNTYTTADFLDDISFINAIKHKTVADVNYWEKWLNTNPPNLNLYREAETQLRFILSAKRIKPAEEFVEQLWNDINANIDRAHRLKIRRLQRTALAVAAAISVVALSFSLWFFNSNITVNTNYGKTQEVLLPDGSRILLNANSSLKYSRAYKWTSTRKVFLKGEAYFKVTHGAPFSAYTQNLVVQVLGAEFNIKERRGITQVALVKGKVAIKGTLAKDIKPSVLKPAELFLYNENTHQSAKTAINTQLYTTWTSNKVIVENATVNSIIKDFEDLYGQRIILEDPALYNRVIDGVIPMGDKDNTLFVIANILDVQIKKTGDTILLKTRKK
jgi:transmembrane sensor